MKKFLALFLTLAVSAPLLALYNGNPASPGIIEEGMFLSESSIFGFRLSYQRDYVYNRRLKVVAGLPNQDIDNFQYIADQGLVNLTFWNRIELYGSFGAARFCSDQTIFSVTRLEFDSHDEFTWGVGTRIRLFQWGPVAIGINGVFQDAHPRFRYLLVDGKPIPSIGSAKIRFREWQVGLGASYQVEMLTPYIVAKYSNVHCKYRKFPPLFFPESRSFKMTNRRKFGLALGATISPMKVVSIGVEVRLIDEESLTLTGKIAF